MKKIQLGQVLVNGGYITEAQLQRALELQKKTPGKRLGEILTDLSYVSETTISKCLSERLKVPYIDLRNYSIDPKAAALLESAYAEKNHVLPIAFRNGQLVVATSDPLAFYTIEEVRSLTGYEISIAVTTEASLKDAITRAYSASFVSSAAADLDREYAEAEEDEALVQMGERVEGTPVVKLINSIIVQAVKSGASDIHFEPARDSLNVRMRINGDLVPHISLGYGSLNSIVTRIKLLSEMNIAEKRVPQDGQFHFVGPDFETDIRASSLPTIYGEKIVLRILGGAMRQELLNLAKLGMDKKSLGIYSEMIKAPNGIILITGPTGSGKSTTLYATLNKLAQRKSNLVTIEDPVEQSIDMVNQVQVNVKAGLTFASALRSILRQDPDIIMVGEMRDGETATLGIRAAITGHLVLSTLHTNDAISSIDRLVDMGVPAYLVAASLTGVVAQRLIKVLCPHCKEKAALTNQEKLLLGEEGADITEVYTPVGCAHCNYTGFIGRTPIYEMIEVDATLRQMINNRASGQEIHSYEQQKGVTFLREAATELVRTGETSMEEMEKIVYSVE